MDLESNITQWCQLFSAQFDGFSSKFRRIVFGQVAITVFFFFYCRIFAGAQVLMSCESYSLKTAKKGEGDRVWAGLDNKARTDTAVGYKSFSL